MLDIHVPADAPPVTITFPTVPTLDHMRHALRELCRAADTSPLMVIVSRSAKRRHFIPRQVLYWLAYRRLGRTSGQISQFVKRDHTTVLKGVRRVDRAIQEGDRRYTDIIAQAMKGDTR